MSIEDTFGSSLDLNSQSTFDPFWSDYTIGNGATATGNQSSGIQFSGPSRGVVQTPVTSQTPFSSSVAKPNAFGDFLGGIGNGFSKIIGNALNTGAQNLANKITSSPTFAGNSTRQTTANTGSLLGNVGMGSVLIIGGVIALVLLLRK